MKQHEFRLSHTLNPRRLLFATALLLALSFSACRHYSYSVFFDLTEDVCGGAAMHDRMPSRSVSTANMRFYLQINGEESTVRADEYGVVRLENRSRGDSLLFFLPERRETSVEIRDAMCERFQTTPDHVVTLGNRRTALDSIAIHKPCNPCLLEEPSGPPPMPHN
jgi:hypothetical protein